MLEVRSTYVDGVLRLAAAGTLESADLPLVNRVLTGHLRTVKAIRLILTRVVDADEASFRVLRYQLAQARGLGIDCVWVDPTTALAQLLKCLDELDHVKDPDTSDLGILSSWPVIA
jgi:anti-anti-sigma regulatory factor